MKQVFLVALGGGIGAVARYTLSGLVLHQTLEWRFPAGTFVVNLVGCLVVGLLAGFIVRDEIFSADTRLFLITGILGGFTTFSAFGIETVYLMRRGEMWVALSYVVLSVVCGIALAWGGMAVVLGTRGR
jgi:fluoride exporter